MEFLKKHSIFAVFILSCALTFLFFRPYFINHRVPFPGNLLVSTYSPWIQSPDPDYPNGPPNKPMGFDNLRQYFPGKQFAKEEILKGKFPLWNPYIYSGSPYFASPDTALFYPFSIVFYLLPLIDAWSFMVIIQPILSLCFMYVFLRSLLRSKVSSFLFSFAYAFSGWMIVYWEEVLVLEHSFLWLPLTLYASNCIWDRKKIQGFFLLSTSLAASMFGGFFQMTLYVYGVVILWNIYRFFSEKNSETRKSKGILTCVSFILSIFLTGVQWIPTGEAYLASSRGLGSGIFLFREFLMPLEHLITLIAPDFWGNPGTYNYFGGKGFYFEKMIFIGILPLIFSLFGMFFVKKTHVRFFAIVGLCALSLGFALPTSWLPYVLDVPILSSSYPTRVFAVFLFCFITIGSYGFDAFLEKPNYFRIFKVFGGLVFFIALLCGFVLFTWITIYKPVITAAMCSFIKAGGICSFIGREETQALFRQYATVSLRNLLIPTCFLFGSGIVIYLARYSKKIFFVCSFLLLFVSSYYFAQKYVYFSERKFVFPDIPVIEKLKEIAGYSRVWGYGNASLEKNLLSFYKIFSTDGYSFLSSKTYGELLSGIQSEGTLSGILRRSDADLFFASEKEALGTGNPYRLRMMSLLGVKYVLETKKGLDKEHKTLEERFPEEHFSLTYEDDTWRIWEYKDAYPRVFLATTIEVVKDKRELVEKIYAPSTDLKQIVFLEKDPPADFSNEKTTDGGRVEIQTYEPSYIRIATETSQDSVLFLSDAYDKGWMAYADGKEVPVYKADYAFRAVFVPKGTHRVEFRYEPSSILVGIGLSSIGVCGVFLVWYMLSFGKKEKK